MVCDWHVGAALIVWCLVLLSNRIGWHILLSLFEALPRGVAIFDWHLGLFEALPRGVAVFDLHLGAVLVLWCHALGSNHVGLVLF